MSHRILVVAAHPDDEVLGCGGTLVKWAEAGAEIHLAFLADGVGARYPEGGVDPAAIDQRRLATQAAAHILGAASISFDDLPDNRMDRLPLLAIIQKVEALIARHRPDTLFTHHLGDLNIDHRLTHQAVITACRPQPGQGVRTLLCFEQPSSTEWQSPGAGTPFLPNWFVDIGDSLERKLAALDAYAAELRDWPHSRSRQGVEHLARWRGASVGCEAAEAFMLSRRIE